MSRTIPIAILLCFSLVTGKFVVEPRLAEKEQMIEFNGQQIEMETYVDYIQAYIEYYEAYIKLIEPVQVNLYTINDTWEDDYKRVREHISLESTKSEFIHLQEVIKKITIFEYQFANLDTEMEGELVPPMYFRLKLKSLTHLMNIESEVNSQLNTDTSYRSSVIGALARNPRDVDRSKKTLAEYKEHLSYILNYI